MYRLLRDIHLAAGLFSCVFVLVYAVSSFQMAHSEWLPLQPRVVKRALEIDPAAAGSPRELARQLMDRHGLRGGLVDARETGGKLEIGIGRTGSYHRAVYDSGASQAEVETRVADFLGMLVWIHRTAGFENPYWLVRAWAGFGALVSLGLLVLGVSGIYLWFQMHSERRVGSVLLALSAGGGLLLLALVRLA